MNPFVSTKTVCVLIFSALVASLFQAAQAAEQLAPGTDPAFVEWRTERIVTRPGVPPLETRSQQGTLEGNPAQATLAMLSLHLADGPQSLAAAGPQPLALDAENVVYTIDFTASDGSSQQFAAHYRPDDARPLYLCATGYTPSPDATYEQARAALVARVLGGNTEGLRVSGCLTLVDNASLAVYNREGPIEAPWPSYWLFMVDDKPTAGWEHPCRYVFLATDLSSFAVQYGRSGLELFDLTQADTPMAYLSLIVPHPVVDAPSPLAGAPSDPPEPLAINLSGSAQNCYAVIISGGINSFNNWQRYWEDSANIYYTLKHKYGLSDDHIIALVSDGTNVANDRNIGTREAPVYANSNPDLDGDSVTDVDGACTLANVQAAFDDMAAILTSNDQLFVFITDHGYQESGWDAGACLWGADNLRDDQLADMTSDLPCPVMYAMETCYSGGFVDDITATYNRVIGAACAYNDTSEGWNHYDPWVYYFTGAVRGYYPATPPAQPWTDGAVCNADGNADNRICFNEAWTLAWNNRASSDVPQLGENPVGLGNSLFMHHFHIALYNNSPVAYSQIPKDFSFQVLSSGWAAVGVASASDHDIKADDNRQLTSPYWTSTYGSTTRDFAVANGHHMGTATHYAQVFFGAASAYNVEAEWLPTDAILGNTYSYTASANETFDLIEANLVAGTSYVATLHVTSGTPDLGLYVYSAAANYGGRGGANWSRNAGGAGVDETLMFRPSTSGYHGIVMVNETGSSGFYTVTIDEAPPLAAPTGVSATDGVSNNAVNVSWNAVTSATHYRVYRNTSNNSGSATALNDWTAGITYYDYTATAGRTYYYWVKAAASSSGDRESAFSASDGGYVDPTSLLHNTAVTAATNPAYYDFIDTNGYWWVVGERRNTSGDIWLIGVYDTPGFSDMLGYSYSPNPVNFVVGDQNHLGSQKRGVLTYRYTGTGTATVEFEDGIEQFSVGTSGTITWPSGDVVKIWDVYLTAGKTYQFTLDVLSGTADLDAALFGSQDAVYIKNRENFLARSASGGAGADETFSFSVPVGATDWYGFCIWANDANAATFNVAIEQITSGIWSGTVSTNWFAATNWVSGIVPTSLLDATIPSGTPYSPVIGSGSAYCRDLVISSGANLTIGPATLTSARDVHVNGLLRMTAGNALLIAATNFYWHAGSTAYSSGSWPSIDINGTLSLDDGTDANLSMFNLRFYGSMPSYIRSYDEDCVLGWVENIKDATTYLALSGASVQSCRINYLYNTEGHTFKTFSSEEIQIQSYYYGSGHLQLDSGVLAFTGYSSTNYPVRLTPGDRLHDLALRGGGTLLLGGDYTNTAPIQGSVMITSGTLDGSEVNMLVRGNWSNTVGTAGFDPGTKTVTFNGVGALQTIRGTNTFYNLVDGRSGGDFLTLRGNTTVLNDFTVHYQTSVWEPLAVQHILDLSDASGKLFLWGSAAVQTAQLKLGGSLMVYGGSLVADDLVNNGLYGYIAIDDGQVTLTQGTTSGEWFDLYGTLHITGGELDLVGGQGDHYWPLSGSCLFTMDGGSLDFHNGGWRILSGFSGAISNGTLRCAGNVLAQTSAFNPAGGSLELYGGINATLQQTAGSTFPKFIVNKNKYVQANMTTDLTVTGDLVIRGGTLSDPSYTLNVHGGWSNVVGSSGFNEGTGTVSFVGSAPAKLWTMETFHNLQIAKTYEGVNGVEIGNTTRVSNDLAIVDGTLELNQGAVLDVNRDLSIASGAGLNADDHANLQIYVGRNWSNLNTTFSKTVGFSPGYDSLVVFDGIGVTGDLTTSAAQETFNLLTIDRPGGGTLRVHDNMLLRDDLNILNGSWSSSGGPYEHRFRGDFVVEPTGSWYDTTATVVFDGTGTQYFDDRSVSGWHKYVVVEKNSGISVLPLVLLNRMLLLANGSLTVREGNMDFNGQFVRCTGNVTVEDGGNITIGAGAWLEVGGGYTLNVQSGGRLEVRGVPANPAMVTHHSDTYAFTMDSGSTLVAQDAIFECMNANGLNMALGSILLAPYTFNGCTFRYGVSGGTLLNLNNTQTFTAQHVSFPINPGGGASNVKKGSSSGVAHLVHADGTFAGETYDSDPLNLVNWHTGASTSLALDGPSTATRGGEYDFTATLTGDMPLTPVTYRWTVTDLSPATHLCDTLSDQMDNCCWSTTGTKTLIVSASNELGTVLASKSVEVAVLAMDITGRHWVGTTNAVDLVIKGTSSGSTYRIQYRPGLSSGTWADADPDGLTVTGLDGNTPWVDMGGPGRDMTASPSMFYRALLLLP